ncbi:pelle-like serine/threonine-protein kinase pik-1 [Neodiprion pinetum]|uniref:pelle-like serine/threonine-protein kinase pik-1 n=1 Tax=Neodiprion pinetum TaxID=441929 RepID=UPI001EDD44ED|nr:pelle-like serine/threonine-protein kinase pik-1 [Neodiprion pinetum]
MDRNRCHDEIVFVYQLPPEPRDELCRSLKQSGKWMDFADHIKCDSETKRQCGSENNPMDALLTVWSRECPRIIDLYCILNKIHEYRLMDVLKKFVSKENHNLIDKGTENADIISGYEGRNLNSKDSKIGSQNFNQIEPAVSKNKKFLISELENHRDTTKLLNNLSTFSLSNDSSVQLAEAGTSKLINKKFLPVESTVLEVPFEDLKVATMGWKIVLGEGSFGTVFRGKLNHRLVAIKRMDKWLADNVQDNNIQRQQLLKEMDILNVYRHDNIINLFAYCMAREMPCLVYQLMENDTLKNQLERKKKKTPLTWLQRHVIAKGIAQGILFLHTGGRRPLIHCNIKSANIYLDKNFKPKIGNFRLAEQLEKDNMKASRISVTTAHLPDDFVHSRKLSTKVDVYSYGIVLIELATGKIAYDGIIKILKGMVDNEEGIYIPFLNDLGVETAYEEVYKILITLGKRCSQRKPEDRLDVESVLQELHELQ